MENGGVGDVDSSSPVNGGTLDVADRQEATSPEGSSAPRSSDIVDVLPVIVGKMSPSPTDDGEVPPTNIVQEEPPAAIDQPTEALPSVNGDSELNNGDQIVNGDVSHADSVVENDHVTATDEVQVVEKRQETLESSTIVEYVERPDGSEEFRLQESKKIVLEEVTSTETARPASEEEMQALELQQQQQEQEQERAADGEDHPIATSDESVVVEISLGKDVVVDEYKRQESLHEQTVDGEAVHFVQTVTEEHTLEEIRETPLSPLENVPDADAVADAADAGTDVQTEPDNSKEEPTNAGKAPTRNDELPAADAASDEATVAESMVTSSSTDEVATKEKGSKSKGIMGFLKARARSQSRERDEQASKDDQKAKKEAQSDEQKKSGTLEREKKFKLNLFGKKGEEEKAEAGEEVKHPLEQEKEASKPKSLKKALFGKKNKDKSVDDAGGDEKDKHVAGEEHGEEGESKVKERKWFHFGKKPAKEVAPAETNDTHAEKEVEVEETKPAAEEAVEEEKQEEPESCPTEQVVNEPVAVAENETGDAEKPSTEIVEVNAPATETPEAATEEIERASATGEGDTVEDKIEQPEVVETTEKTTAEEVVTDSITPNVADNEVVEEKKADVEDPQPVAEVNIDTVDDQVEMKEASPGGTLQKEAEAELKEQSKDHGGKTPKKFSFGFKFGKKQKTQETANDQLAKDDENAQLPASTSQDLENQTTEQAPDSAVEAVQPGELASDVKQPSDDVKNKPSKIKLFHFGKKSKSKQQDDDEKEPQAQEEENAEVKTDVTEEAQVDNAIVEPQLGESQTVSEEAQTVADQDTVTEKVIEVIDSGEVREEETHNQQETKDSAEPDTDQKELVEVSVDTAEAPETDVKQEQREQKKSLFGIKFSSKHESKDDEQHADDGHKAKEARWSPFGKKLGKKCTVDAGKSDGEGHKEELEQKAEETEASKAEENVDGEEGTAEDTPEVTEPTDTSTKQAPAEAKEKSAHVRMSKLFSFGKKEKPADEKPANSEAKTEEAPTESATADAGEETSKARNEPQNDDDKKVDEPEAEKKEESNFTTNIRKLFTIGKKNKDQHDEKKVEETNDEESEQKPTETSPETKPKSSKVSREKSPHRKFPFEIKFGKKKDKEEVESPTKDVKSSEHVGEVAAEKTDLSDQETPEAGQTIDIGVHSPVAENAEDPSPDATDVPKIDEVDQPVAEDVTQVVDVAVTESQPEPAKNATDEIVTDTSTTEDQSSAEASAAASENKEEAISEETQPLADQPATVELESCQEVLTTSSVAPEAHIEDQEDIPVAAAVVETNESSDQPEQPEQPAAQEPQEIEHTEDTSAAIDEPSKIEEVAATDSGVTGKENKGRKRFPFGFKFGKRSERAKSAERAIPAKTTQVVTDGDGKVELAKTVEASASVPDVRLHVEAAAGDQSTNVAATGDAEKTTDTPTKSGGRHELPHINIKWPHFGKKKHEDVEPAVGEVETKTDESEKGSTPKKQQQQQQTPTSTPLTDSQKKSSLGKGIFKMFSPRRHGDLTKSASCSAGDDKEPIVSYSVEGEGQILAETQWRSKTLSAAPGIGSAAARLSKSPTTVDQRSQEPLVDVVADVAESKHGAEQVPIPGGHFVVVAIDFGTTYSGYAFSFARDARSAAGQSGGIHMMRRWEGGDPGVVNQKTPTTMLLTPGGEFHSFGFTARDFYHDLDPSEANKWLYFEKFKMDLHQSTELNSETTIRSSNGHEFPALQLFAISLRYFKEHALKELSSQSATIIVNEDVRWVITVPAIWKAPAKQFMRQAAYEAGIASVDTPDNLLIALEPEAASIYIRQLRLSQLVPERSHVINRTISPPPPQKDSTIVATSNGVEVNGDVTTSSKEDEGTENDHVIADEFHAGTRYMVVDCGGGTVDITVHEMENESGNLKELYKATGGPYGSTGVDREFEKLLCDIFGNDFIESFKSKRPAGWVDLMIAFESRKRAAHPHKTNALNVSLPFSFIDFHKKHFGAQVESAIKKYSDKDVHWSMQGMLRLMPDAMKRLFHSTLESIKNAVSQVINNPQVSGIEYMFLVGGFAESPILQFEMRREFEHLLKIIIPQEVSLTILKGAVCFGLDPTVVTVRKSRLTYGVGVLNRFVRGVHPESKLVRRGGGDLHQPEAEWCRDVFDLFVAADQSVGLGDTVLRRYTPAEHGQTVTVIHIYSAETSDVRFVTDDGVQRCGTLRLELPSAADADASGGGRRREIQTRMTFGDTEIKVWALDVASGRSVRASIDFLNK